MVILHHQCQTRCQFKVCKGWTNKFLFMHDTHQYHKPLHLNGDSWNKGGYHPLTYENVRCLHQFFLNSPKQSERQSVIHQFENIKFEPNGVLLVRWSLQTRRISLDAVKKNASATPWIVRPFQPFVSLIRGEVPKHWKCCNCALVSAKYEANALPN